MTQKLTLGGKLIVTNYQIVFVTDDKKICQTHKIRQDYFVVPFGFISRYHLSRIKFLHSVERSVDKKTNSQQCIDVISKDGRCFKFVFAAEDKESLAEKVFARIEAYSFSKDELYIFAFYHTLSDTDANGWKVFSDEAEYKRMGINVAAPVYGLCDIVVHDVQIF